MLANIGTMKSRCFPQWKYHITRCLPQCLPDICPNSYTPNETQMFVPFCHSASPATASPPPLATSATSAPATGAAPAAAEVPLHRWLGVTEPGPRRGPSGPSHEMEVKWENYRKYKGKCGNIPWYVAVLSFLSSGSSTSFCSYRLFLVVSAVGVMRLLLLLVIISLARSTESYMIPLHSPEL